MTKADRQAVNAFLELYSGHLGLNIHQVRYPEDLKETPSDARIDAVCDFGHFDLHLEHSSVDLIASGRQNKRSLDPAFRILESHLKTIDCPSGRGIIVGLPFDYAEDIPAIKGIAPLLTEKLSQFLAEPQDEEWRQYPSTPTEVVVADYIFEVIPDLLEPNDVSLEWIGSKANYVTTEQLEAVLAKLLPSKLAKLSRSVSTASRPGYGVLLIETPDKAARGFEAFRISFDRFMDTSSIRCREIWGYREGNRPTLIWQDIKAPATLSPG
jgi:hypothetical protein